MKSVFLRVLVDMVLKAQELETSGNPILVCRLSNSIYSSICLFVVNIQIQKTCQGNLPYFDLCCIVLFPLIYNCYQRYHWHHCYHRYQCHFLSIIDDKFVQTIVS